VLLLQVTNAEVRRPAWVWG